MTNIVEYDSKSISGKRDGKMYHNEITSHHSLRGGRVRYLCKIGILSLILILTALVAIPVSAEEVNVLSEQQAALWQGQTSQVYEATLYCPGTVTVVSDSGALFNIYAERKSGYSSCPPASSIMRNYDKAAYGNGRITSMALSSGVWCIMVYGYSGSGSYTLRITSSCAYPNPYPTAYPTVYPTPYPTAYPTQPWPCGVYKTDLQQGFLNQGQAKVYGYYIPTDGRSKIDWSMTSSGSCGGDGSPIIAASVGSPSTQSSACSGSSTFDLYVFKDCNPKNSYCSTRYYSYGPNSYVSIASPSSGSTYYVMVFARSGSGTYNLKMNSYKCTSSGGTPIIASSKSDVNTQASGASAGADDTGSGSEVSAPSAEFVQDSSQ
jgi:hypothetical protein